MREGPVGAETSVCWCHGRGRSPGWLGGAAGFTPRGTVVFPSLDHGTPLRLSSQPSSGWRAVTLAPLERVRALGERNGRGGEGRRGLSAVWKDTGGLARAVRGRLRWAVGSAAHSWQWSFIRCPFPQGPAAVGIVKTPGSKKQGPHRTTESKGDTCQLSKHLKLPR